MHVFMDVMCDYLCLGQSSTTEVARSDLMQRGSSRSGSSKARACCLELDWLSSARLFLSFEPLARLSSIISKF